MDGGYGPKGKDTLKSALRSGLAERGQRRQVRVIETRCMGICPKKAVTALNADRPGTILTIARRTGADDALASLMDGIEKDRRRWRSLSELNPTDQVAAGR
jgi:predicted metal-binding protein